MFKLFKNLIKRKNVKEPSKEELLASWLATKSQRLSKAKSKLSRHKEQASLEIQELENQVAALHKTEIVPGKIGGSVTSCPSCSIPGLPNSPDRIIHLAKGNRDRYVSVLNEYISWLKSWQEKIDEADLGLCSEFEDKLNSFGSKTNRNFAIISEVIGDEAIAVLESLKKVNKLNRKVRAELDKAKLAEVAKIDTSLKDIEILKEKIKDIKRKEKSLGADAENAEKELEDENKELEKIKASKEISELNLNKTEQEKASLDVKNKEREIRSFFNQYQKAMKKYLYKNPSCKVDYLDDSVLALEEDNELKVINVLIDIKKDVDNINLTEKQKDDVRNLKPDYIKKLKENLVAARRKKFTLEKKGKSLLESESFSQIRKKKDILKGKLGALNRLKLEKEELAKNANSLKIKLELMEKNVELGIKEVIG